MILQSNFRAIEGKQHYGTKALRMGADTVRHTRIFGRPHLCVYAEHGPDAEPVEGRAVHPRPAAAGHGRGRPGQQEARGGPHPVTGDS